MSKIYSNIIPFFVSEYANTFSTPKPTESVVNHFRKYSISIHLGAGSGGSFIVETGKDM